MCEGMEGYRCVGTSEDADVVVHGRIQMCRGVGVCRRVGACEVVDV